ncbi:MAG: aspartyl protease family protein [Desulfuromusa sp.]|nr:aspartyl protease family protein [Desulfuromusa sp.]
MLLIIVTIGLGTATIVNGQMYRWVDENGQLHFSNSPQDVPAEVRNKNNEYNPDSSSITISSDSKNYVESPADSDSKTLSKDTISIPYTAKEGYANRVIIDITFNGQVTVPMLVDTGSPGLVISNSLADHLNLFDEEDGRLMVVISGIGGRKIATKTIIDKLTLGEITENFIPAHIVSGMSSSHYQGLIGMDVLSNYTMTIDPTQHKLVANLIPAARELPAGRNRSWWQANFREFGFYNEYWEQQEGLIGKSDSPYARLSSSEQERIKSFVLQQKNIAAELYNKLERYARFNSVPRHWRR